MGRYAALGLPLDQLCACAAARKCSSTCATQLGIQPGETTADGKMTLEFAECLGACEFAPCMLADDDARTRI